MGNPECDGLTPEQIKFFNDNGYLVLKGFASPDQCQQLMQRMDELIERWDPETETSVFTTDRQTRTTDQYFLDSADQIHFFLEAKARGDDGKLKQAKHLSLNKVGHGLHVRDDIFRAFVHQPKIARAVKSLGYMNPEIPQTMFIFKQPFIGGEVTTHQDSTFLYTEPPSCLGLWFALEPATKDNGCLWAVPGSHTSGVHSQFVRNSEYGTRPDEPLMKFRQRTNEKPSDEELRSKMACVEMDAGDVILIHGAVEHMSLENTSGKSRRSFQIHLVEGQDRATWSPENWLQYPAGQRFPTFDNWDKY